MDQQAKAPNRQSSPYFASVNFEPEKDTQEERTELTRKLISLPRAIRYGLLDSQTQEDILRVSNSFGLSQSNKLGEVSRMVRRVFLEEGNREEIKKAAQEKLGLDTSKFDEFSSEIDRIAKKAQQRGEEEIAANSEQLPIIPALKKYEKLGGQEITEGFIDIEVEEEKKSVEPTIRNWLEDYIQNKGAQAHDNLERSDYLYKTENTEILSTLERDKLALVLRSYDLDETLPISKRDQEVFFENVPHEQENGQVLIKKKKDVESSFQKKEGDQKNQVDEISQSKQEEKVETRGSQQGAFERMLGQEDVDEERSANKPHEITWYGKSSPFDNLEQIDVKQSSQEKLENRSAITTQKESEKKVDFSANNIQKTKHVVDLKTNS